MELFDRIKGSIMHEIAFEALMGAIDDSDPNVQRQLAQPYETFANEDCVVTRHRFRKFWRLLVRCLDRCETISQSQFEIIKKRYLRSRERSVRFRRRCHAAPCGRRALGGRRSPAALHSEAVQASVLRGPRARFSVS